MMILIMAAIIAQGEMYHKGRGYFLTLKLKKSRGILDELLLETSLKWDFASRRRGNS